MLGLIQFSYCISFSFYALVYHAEMRVRLLTTVSSTKQILKQNTLYYIVAITGYLETSNCVKQNGFIGKIYLGKKTNIGLGARDL